jgi:hypothetical protein
MSEGMVRFIPRGAVVSEVAAAGGRLRPRTFARIDIFDGAVGSGARSRWAEIYDRRNALTRIAMGALLPVLSVDAGKSDEQA